MNHNRSLPLVLVLGGLGLLATALLALPTRITELVCGAAPIPGSPWAAMRLLIVGDPYGYSAAPGCEIPTGLIRLVAATGFVLLMAVMVASVIAYARYKQSDRAFIADLRNRPGFATAHEVRSELSSKAVLRLAGQLRPNLARRPEPSDVGWPVGKSRGQDVYVSIEDSVVLEGAPRAGKGYRILIPAILDWSGPLVTTSTTNDNLTATLRHRRRRGDVHVFDPQGLSGIRDPLRISPVAGCEDPLVAVQRGTAIITGTALGNSTNNAEWAQAASTVLARLLHAAAVGQRSVADLYDWGSSPQLARAAVAILRDRGADGWGDGLDALLSADQKVVSSTWFGVQAAVSPLAIPQIREALSPRPDDVVFDPNSFLTSENTLYLIGSASGAAAMGGFLSAILDDIVEVARRKALSSPGSRLEQPLGLILDEIVNMFRWAALPRIMADGGGRGICTLVVLQALSQAETIWSRAEADTIWAAATAKILLGGASDVAHLRDIESLLGTRQRRRLQRSWSSQHAGESTSEQLDVTPLMTVDEIRRMPRELGLLSYRNRRPVLLDLEGWTSRRDAMEIHRDRSSLQLEQQEHFSALLRPVDD